MAETFDGIIVRGAREHNLKHIDLEIPRNKITVITGLSGSGKSSFAFDTVYAEGQRRYVESLSAYARNFLQQLKKPEVDVIHGLSPAIAIDQKSVSTNPRSTVGTVTEIYDYLRLLYARVGQPQCPTHKLPVSSQLPKQIVDDILGLPAKTKYYIMAPVVESKKGEFLAEFQRWAKKGFVKAKVDGEFIELAKAKKLKKTKVHDIDIVVDQLVAKEGIESRLRESVNAGLGLAKGQLAVEVVGGERKSYSIHAACPECGYSFPELEPRMLSFNNPRGACQTCSGLGVLDEDEYSKADSDEMDEEEVVHTRCPDCEGTRLNERARNILINQKTITALAALSVLELRDIIAGLQWSERDMLIAEKIQKQILGRLDYMIRVGTSYLSLDRPTRTLSGGEAQRIRLATQVGSALVGVLYVLDEPSIGLHPRDHSRLLNIITELKDRGNTVLMVEHDEETIRTADHIVDFGPRAGVQGGQVLAQGTMKQIMAVKGSLTAQYLSGAKKIPVPDKRRTGNGSRLVLKCASGNNLHDVDLELPLGTFICVTGVSGSGKSTLIIDTLYRILAQQFYRAKTPPSAYESISGLEHLDKVIEINQRPIGRTPRSTPATYVGLFPMIRDLFAALPESKLRGYKPGRFSFNVKGGQCEMCQGQGQIRMEMHFLSDVFVLCDSCQGRRYNRETLGVKYKDKNIAQILEMTVGEASEFFKHHTTIHRKLTTLERVGLDYISLGQSSTTLSGGEAQRVKLSKELSKRGTGQTLYILDEPTTGLHFDDIRKLTELLQELTDQGNTVLVIEHNLDVIKCADHLVDLGPEGGIGGGEIVAAGTPEEVAKNKRSITGEYLTPYL